MWLPFYLSLCLHNPFTVSELSWLKYVKEKFKFTNFTKCLANWLLEIMGWGKTRPAHSFPPLLFSNLSIYLSVFRNLLLPWLSCPKEKFKLRKHLANCMFLLNSRVGKDWADPFFPPSLIFRSSIYRFVFRFMLLFHSILTFMKDLYQSGNQVFNSTRLLVLLHCGVGKDWAGPFFPPSKMFGSFYLSSRCLDYVIFCCIWTLLTCTKQRIKFSNQQNYS